jgi:glycine dehydrogenase subunit 2
LKKFTSRAVHLKEEIIFKKGAVGRKAYSLPDQGNIIIINKKVSNFQINDDLKREKRIPLPELSEGEIVRHFTRLSSWNYNIDQNFYPLGSCTMKYNPRLNEEIATDINWGSLHPDYPVESIQGALELIYDLEQHLLQLTDMQDVSLQPAAGAHGELTSLFIIREYFRYKNEDRKKILIPDSAHGTNPASCVLAGFEVCELKSDSHGQIDLNELERLLDQNTACLMLTIPNTFGIFEEDILKISKMLKKNGSLFYMDGANLNAILGKVSLSEMGVDICQLNLHKTFSSPHGGGGPGSGPIVVSDILKEFLPGPKIKKDKTDYYCFYTPVKSIGKIKSYYGHFGIMIRALSYILTFGNKINNVAEHAVLNANYLKSKLKDNFQLASLLPMMHEIVFSDKKQKSGNVFDPNKLEIDENINTLDFAKSLLDFGFHPPTIYFPLTVSGALMIEPTETETVEEIDNFSEVLNLLDEIRKSNPEYLHGRPKRTFVKKLDEVAAARKPILNYFDKDS